MKVIKPPYPIDEFTPVSVFLAGSIEMGAATNWQERIANSLSDIEQGEIWNPRRDNWDATWEQDIHHRLFKQQVEWEWNGIGMADITAFYFEPNTKSPITLMELGYATGMCTDDVVIYCPKGFWRKGNVDVVANIHGIPVHETEEAFIQALRKNILAYLD